MHRSIAMDFSYFFNYGPIRIVMTRFFYSGNGIDYAFFQLIRIIILIFQ